MRVFDCIKTERAAAIAKAVRLFYNPDEGDPITPGQFDDELANMTRRMWGLVCTIGDVMSDREGAGVMQIANDVAREMERLAEAFEAERWLAKEPA
ncbi:hypothetical protein [Methylocystis sp.]|uniref:hypothetical protein n=1 Tax=Methylocystis sp. TaxID=1911079 RepID=UPI0025D03A0F|nr:hypothetical protein [Methylocystis sp.]